MAFIPFPDGVSLNVDEILKTRGIYTGDPRVEFIEEMHAHGMKPPSTIVVDHIERIQDAQDKGLKRSGWYFYTEIQDGNNEGQAIGIGSFGSWRGTPERVAFCSKPTDRMGMRERADFQLAQDLMRAKREAEQATVHKEAAHNALMQYDAAIPATNHNYLTAKGISTTDGVRVASDGRLLIPVYDESGLISLQRIAGDGSKRFLTGGKTKGGFFFINGHDAIVYVAEGYATAASVHMATGAMIYVAFSCQNLYEVTAIAKKRHPQAQIVIAADNDRFTAGNPGKTKAEQAANGLGVLVALPDFESETSGVDFNDLHQAQGLDAVKAILQPREKTYQATQAMPFPEFDMEPPEGVLRDIYNYYNATSGVRLPAFAVQTALAIASVVLGRRFSTTSGNFASLYFMNVAKSGTGKEHAKHVVYKVLSGTKGSDLIGGGGYTAGAAVHTALLIQPRHIAIIDEFGRMLQAGASSKDGHQVTAMSELMKCIGSLHGILPTNSYSAMSDQNKKAGAKAKRIVRPAITMLAMTTPSTLFKAIDHESVADGFLGRFILSITDKDRAFPNFTEMFEPPESIKQWVDAAIVRSGVCEVPDNAEEEPPCVKLAIEHGAHDVYREFWEYCAKEALKLEPLGLEALNNRTAEMALRIALIVALTENPHAESVSAGHMQWACSYMRQAHDTMVSVVKRNIAGSEFEAAKKAALFAIRAAGEKGITRTDMNKKQPFAKWKPKDRNEIMAALMEADLVFMESVTSKGRAGLVYYAKE